MSTSAILSQGTKLAVSANASPPSYSDIPELRTIGGPDGTAPTIDVTDLDSTAREYVLGLKDEGAFSCGFMYIPANAVHASLRAAWSARTQLRFRLTFTDSGTTVWEFNGFVTGLPTTIGIDTVVEGSLNIKITGSILETT